MRCVPTNSAQCNVCCLVRSQAPSNSEFVFPQSRFAQPSAIVVRFGCSVLPADTCVTAYHISPEHNPWFCTTFRKLLQHVRSFKYLRGKRALRTLLFYTPKQHTSHITAAVSENPRHATTLDILKQCAARSTRGGLSEQRLCRPCPISQRSSLCEQPTHPQSRSEQKNAPIAPP